MQPNEAIKQRVDDNDVIVLLTDPFGEPHERVEAVFDDMESFEIYRHHQLSETEEARSRVEIHGLRSKSLIEA